MHQNNSVRASERARARLRAATRAASATALLAAVFSSPSVMADHGTRPDSHAPIGVMGDHTHKRGELMLSYRFMHMDMAGNRSGTDDLAASEIATTVTNPFFGRPMQPPTLRVVPTSMTMDMHMVGAMVAPTDRLTLMAMFNYLDKEMDHTTFAGGMGDTVLGTFTTRTRGMGDTRIAGLLDFAGSNDYRFHLTLGLSLPTGDIEETDRILAPNGMQPSPRLPYPMQLGSGTYDLIVGLTFAEERARFGWGSQWQSLVRMGENDEDYTLGDEHHLTLWSSYLLNDSFSVSARASYLHRDNIDGADPLIAAPVQTADPSNHGMDRVDLAAGVNWLLPGQKNRLSLEFAVPVYQDLDGPQLETDWTLSLGYQLSF